MEEFIGLSTDESLMSNNSSLSGGGGGVGGVGIGIVGVNDDRNMNTVFMRFAELEKKLSDQSDEIVCLKSTLADVLRRLNQLEGRAIVTTSYHHLSPSSSHHHHQNSNGKNVYNNRGSTIYSNKIHGRNLSTLSNGSVQNNNNNNNEQISSLYPSNNHRRYLSSTSLQYDMTTPAASPQSNHHHHHHNNNHNYRSISSMNHSKSLMRMNSGSNLKSMKRWSASQDIRFSSIVDPNVNNLKDFHYNQVEGVIKFNICDRQIIINIPTDLLQTYTIKNVTSPPLQRLKLEWAYGYRGRDCRHNLYLLPTGEIVYFIAAVVVLYNIDDQIQRHYNGHTSEIRCLTIHPNKLLIATGQNVNQDSRFEKRPHVRIWDSVSLNTLHILGQNGEFDRGGISCISFSKFDGGNLLCVVDESNDHMVSLWEWHKGLNGHKISEAKSTCDAVLAAEFHPIEKNILITIGKGHIHFWDIEGGSLAKKIGSFEKQDKPKYILCMTFNDVGELLTGDSNGNIIVWHQNSGRMIRTIFNAHDGSIFDICTLKDGTIVTGGGKDKKIIEWNANMNRTGREAKLPDQYGGVRTLTTGKGSMLIVGTTKNCILQGTMSLNFSLVIQGHTEELCALAIHPTQNQFITGGYDKNIHLWDTMSHLVVWSKDIGESVHASSFSPDGSIIIISTMTVGRWMVLDSTTRQLISMHNDGSDLIECIKFSPNGRYVALGSRDNNIYVYQVSDEYRKFNRIGRCSGHTSYVISIDWDTSNTYIQTTSILFEHLFWNASICRQLNNVSIARDLEFVTHNSMIGFNVFGVWPDNFDNGGPFISTMDRSHNCKLLLTGDDVGRLNLFTYPSCQPKCLHHSYVGHTSTVPNARFLADDSRIISIGGKDSSILQWSVCCME